MLIFWRAPALFLSAPGNCFTYLPFLRLMRHRSKSTSLAASPGQPQSTAPVKQPLGLGSNTAHRLQHRPPSHAKTSRQEDSWRSSSWQLAKPPAAGVSDSAEQRLERSVLKSLPLSPPSSASRLPAAYVWHLRQYRQCQHHRALAQPEDAQLSVDAVHIRRSSSAVQ